MLSLCDTLDEIESRSWEEEEKNASHYFAVLFQDRWNAGEKERLYHGEGINYKKAKPSDTTTSSNRKLHNWTMLLIKHHTKKHPSICKHGNIIKMMEMIPMWCVALQMAAVNVCSLGKRKRVVSASKRQRTVRLAYMLSYRVVKRWYSIKETNTMNVGWQQFDPAQSRESSSIKLSMLASTHNEYSIFCMYAVNRTRSEGTTELEKSFGLEWNEFLRGSIRRYEHWIACEFNLLTSLANTK